MLKFMSMTTAAYFVNADGSTCAREIKPTFSDAYSLGNILSYETNNDAGNEVLQKPTARGVWSDHTVFTTQDVETFTLNGNEISDTFMKLARRANSAISGGSGSFKPGVSTVSGYRQVGEGWLRIDQKDQNGLLVERVERYVFLELPRMTYAKGVLNYSISGRRLESTLITGAWSNLT